MSDPFLGQINMFGFNFAVRGWAFCNGQLLPIAQYSAVFSLLGTTYGGDGRTTFALPDMRGRVPINAGGGINGSRGPGLSDYGLGQKGGVEDVTLNITQIPAHNHVVGSQLRASTATTANSPQAGDSLSASATASPGALDGFVDMSPQAIANTVSNTGGSQSHTNVQPYLAVNFEIALQGIFPSRS